MNSRIKYITLTGLLAAVCACSEISVEDNPSTGFLGTPVFDVDLSVDVFTMTKAPVMEDLQSPDLAKVTFIVKDKDGEEKYKGTGAWTDPITMPVGSYTVDASYGSNGFGKPCYSGKFEGTIEPLKTVNPAINVKLQNARIAVGLGEDFKQHFSVSGENPLTITSASGSLTGVLDTYYFVPAGEELTISIDGSSSAGVQTTLTYNITLNAATATYVECGMTSVNAPEITMNEVPTENAWGTIAYVPAAETDYISDDNIEQMRYFASNDGWKTSTEGFLGADGLVKFTGLKQGKTYSVQARIGSLTSKNTVSMTMSTKGLSGYASHSYTSEILDGTDFTASYSIPDIFKSGITNVTLSLCKEDGTELRSMDLGTNSTGTSYGSVDSNWPYLPSGNYIVKGQAVQEGTPVNFSKENIEVSSPDFKVNTPSAHTSYNTYNDSGANAANAEDGSTIYGVTHNGVKISDNILSNGKYSSLIGDYTYFIDGVKASAGDHSGQKWAAHAVTAKFTFDGTTAESSPLTCHVTGLPYRCTNFSNESGNWEASNSAITFSSDGIHFYTPSGKPTVTFKKNFTFPDNTNIVISAVFYKENKSATRSSTLALNFGSYQLSTTEYGSEKTLSGNYSVIGSIGMSGSFSYSLANRTADARIGNIIILYN